MPAAPSDNLLFILGGHNRTRGRGLEMVGAVKQAGSQPERRRADRAALRLAATLREGSRRKVKVRLIDISTHGCRIECSPALAPGKPVSLDLAGLDPQPCRIVWRCEEFAGLEFETPLADAAIEALLDARDRLPEAGIEELRDIAARTHGLARQADDADIHALAELSRACALNALIEGLRRGDTGPAGHAEPPTEPPADE